MYIKKNRTCCYLKFLALLHQPGLNSWGRQSWNSSASRRLFTRARHVQRHSKTRPDKTHRRINSWIQISDATGRKEQRACVMALIGVTQSRSLAQCEVTGVFERRRASFPKTSSKITIQINTSLRCRLLRLPLIWKICHFHCLMTSVGLSHTRASVGSSSGCQGATVVNGNINQSDSAGFMCAQHLWSSGTTNPVSEALLSYVTHLHYLCSLAALCSVWEVCATFLHRIAWLQHWKRSLCLLL